MDVGREGSRPSARGPTEHFTGSVPIDAPSPGVRHPWSSRDSRRARSEIALRRRGRRETVAPGRRLKHVSRAPMGTKMIANDNRPPGRPQPPGNRANVAALVAVLVIGLALFWAVSAIRARDAVQDCIDSGRHDCVELR